MDSLEDGVSMNMQPIYGILKKQVFLSLQGNWLHRCQVLNWQNNSDNQKHINN